MIISANFNKYTHEAYKNRKIGIHVFDCAAGFSQSIYLTIEDATTLRRELVASIEAQRNAERNAERPPILEAPIGVVNEDLLGEAEWLAMCKQENRCHVHANLLNENDECDTCERDKNGDHWS